MNGNVNMIRADIADPYADFLKSIGEAERRLANGDSSPEFWYRGHDCGVYTLTPSLFRYEEPEEKEVLMFEICDQNVKDPEYGPDSWSKVGRMQHYGIPTRLLDWTTEPNIALFFAVKFLMSQKGEEELKRRAPHEMPCIYVLNPLHLNRSNDIRKIPTVPDSNEPEFAFDRRFTKKAFEPLVFPLAVAPRPKESNKRQYAQRGRFTVQGSNPDPLEIVVPACVCRITLSIELCDVLRQNTKLIGYDALQLFPDHEGIAQFVGSKARLKLVPYDQRLAGEIRRRLKKRNEQEQTKGNRGTRNQTGKGLFGSCNFGAHYIRRPKGKRQLVKRLAKAKGSPFIVVVGEAGIGKTNFILEALLCHKKLKDRASLFFPLRLFGSSSEGSKSGRSNSRLLPQLYMAAIGDKSTIQEQEVVRQMIREGNVILALDGLDELARNRGQDAVKNVIFELEALVSGSEKARIILSCRDHIFQRLQETGSLGKSGNDATIKIKSIKREAVQKALWKEFHRELAELPQYPNLPQLAVLALLAETPLLYQMIRSAIARNHLR